MTKIRFKQPGATINWGGHQITQNNINEELYNQLVNESPSNASLFDVIDEEETVSDGEEPAEKPARKSKSAKNQSAQTE